MTNPAPLRKIISTEVIMWDLYQSSPEMQQINSALAAIRGREEKP